MKKQYSNIIFTCLQLQSWLCSELINSKQVKQVEKANIRKIMQFADSMLRRFNVVNRKNKSLEESKDYMEDEAAYLLDANLILLSLPKEYRMDFLKQSQAFQQSAIKEVQERNKAA